MLIYAMTGMRLKPLKYRAASSGKPDGSTLRLLNEFLESSFSFIGPRSTPLTTSLPVGGDAAPNPVCNSQSANSHCAYFTGRGTAYTEPKTVLADVGPAVNPVHVPLL